MKDIGLPSFRLPLSAYSDLEHFLGRDSKYEWLGVGQKVAIT